MNSNSKEPAQAEAEAVDAELSGRLALLPPPCRSLCETSSIPRVPRPQCANPWTSRLDRMSSQPVSADRIQELGWEKNSIFIFTNL